MRKLLGCLALVLALSAFAAPALAHPQGVRDPFAPLIQPTPAGAATAPGETVPAAPVQPPAPTDPLPDTGSSSTTWVGLGYVLVVLGGGAVVLSRVYGPFSVR